MDSGGREVLAGISDPREAELHKALQALKDDLTVAEFLRRNFAVRVRSVTALHEADGPRATTCADPERASTLALRDEWMGRAEHASSHRRRLRCPLSIFFPRSAATAELRSISAQPHPPLRVSDGRVAVRCTNGGVHDCDAAILTVPLPSEGTCFLRARDRAATAAHVGFRQRHPKFCCASRLVGGSISEWISPI
jgi:hypothetical protein